MSLPWPIWLPTGALILSMGAFVALVWLAWDRAPDGERWHAGFGWAASWAVVGIVASVFATLLGIWWEASPW